MNGGFLDDFKNAFSRPNNAHAQLIIINVIFFVLIGMLRVFIDHALASGGFTSVLSFVAMPSNIETFLYRPWTLITYMFTHIGFFHILMNMLLLYWFGKIVTEFLGGAKVIILYVLGGLAGGLLYLLLYNLLPLYRSVVDLSILFGASAGVLAVVVGAATFLPNYTIHMLFIGPVRIKYIALVAVVLSFIQSTGENAGGEIAHLGGALIGFLYIKQLQRGHDWGSWIMTVLTFFKSFFVKQSNIKVSYKKHAAPKSRTTTTSRATSTASSRASQEEIDAILDKISERGYESLTTDEKQKLFNASKK